MMNSNKQSQNNKDSNELVSPEIIKILAETAYCRPKIIELAEKLDPLTAEKSNAYI